jgi:hypothetical protein
MNFKESGTEFTITIPDGNYNAIELGTIMTSLMNTTSPANIAVPNTRTYSVLFSNTSLKCTISCNSSFDIPLLTGSNILSNISDILGFTQTTDLTGTISYVGQGIAFLCSTSYLYLKSDLVEGTDAGIIVANNTTDKNILARIPLDSVPGDLLLYASNKENIIWFSSQRVVSQIRIYITLKNNIAVNLNGADVTLKLGIYT